MHHHFPLSILLLLAACGTSTDTKQAEAPPRADLLASHIDSTCLLYTSDAADERSSVDLGGRRIIKKNKHVQDNSRHHIHKQTKK